MIQQIRRDSERRAGPGVSLGIGDDCAVLRPPRGHEVLVTTDFTLEGRHFRRDWHSPESAGHRTLARGLSDLAAMGARPLAAFLSLALPAATPQAWITRYFSGLRDLADRYQVPLAGGDTAQSPTENVLADIVLVGSAPRGTALRRSGARSGDLLYCTGSLGGAAGQLLSLQEVGRKRKDALGHPQLFPEPRGAVGEALRRRGVATACMDLSDGLSSDLRQLCDASQVAAVVELSKIPLHPWADGRMDLALNGGEDYELLFAARPGTRVPRRIAGVPITCIGCFTSPRGVPQVTQIKADGSKSEMPRGGWEHLRT
ncbi:MAG TPA: thiamine-phosphate kinase [Granulicella sp.]|nr:thiamine-phosphate kinase [Granulicella sp.]